MNESTIDSKVKLKWEKSPLLDFINSKKLRDKLCNKGGIYLWEDKFPDGKDGRCAYVGKATSKTGLWKRQLVWYFQQINGQAQIPGEIRQSRELWRFDSTSPNCIQTITNIDFFKSLVDDAFHYVKQITVFWAELSDDDLNKAGCTLSDIEHTLMWKPNPRPWANSQGIKYPPSVPVTVEHKGEVPKCLHLKIGC